MCVALLCLKLVAEFGNLNKKPSFLFPSTPPPPPPPPPRFHHLKLAFKKNLVTLKNGPQCARPFYVLYFFEFGNPDSPLSPSLLLGHALYIH